MKIYKTSKDAHTYIGVSAQTEDENINPILSEEPSMKKSLNKQKVDRKLSDKEYFVPFSMREVITLEEDKNQSEDVQPPSVKHKTDTIPRVTPSIHHTIETPLAEDFYGGHSSVLPRNLEMYP